MRKTDFIASSGRCQAYGVFFADSTADPDLFALLRAARREMQTGVLILDGPELMVENRSPCPAANPYNEVCLREAASAMVLNEFAKQCHLSVLAAVPLSRDTEHRTDHRPKLSDVRYHRRFVDEADTVVLLWRDSYYSDGGDPAMKYRIVKRKDSHA